MSLLNKIDLWLCFVLFCFGYLGASFKSTIGGTWVAQSVERPTLDFRSGYDLKVDEIEPCTGLGTIVLSLLEMISLTPPLSAPLSLLYSGVRACSLSLSK